MDESGDDSLGFGEVRGLHPGARDPDVARVRALVETRMLGEAVAPVRIGRFTLLERVGEGGMSVVFAAYDAVLDRKIALKLLHRDRDHDAVVRQRIVREAQAMARLSHPNVAHVYEVGEHEGRTFIAMEFVRGQTLRAWAEEQRRGWREILPVYVQAGRGLAAAHAAGLVHRDFKPDNAIFDADGRVRVLDFGLARLDASEPSASETSPTLASGDALTRTGSIMGTPAYMAPEQRVGGIADARSDQFSFCVALWEALHGARPRMDVETPVSNRDVPSWLCDAIARGLAPETAQRYPSMDALMLALAADPSSRRRRLVVGSVAIVAIAAVLGGIAIDRERREQACADEAASIAEVWNDDARERMKAALLGTGASYAASSWASVEPRLDRYAAEWSETREHTCLAATVEHTQSTELAVRANECLAERRLAFESFVDLTSVDDPPLVGAVSGAATLPRLQPCTSDAALLQWPARPDDPEQRERIVALEHELTRNATLLPAMRFAEGLPRARELADQAAALGWPPTHAHALADLGAFATDAHDVALAESSLTSAAEIALEHGADELAALAMGRLVTVIAMSRVDLDRGLWWGWLAGTVLDRQQEVDPVRRIELYERMGGLHHQRASFREAKDAFAQAVALGEATFGPDHPTVIEAIDGAAFAQIELGEIDEAIASLERGIASLEQSVGAEHPYVGNLLESLGGALGRSGDKAGRVKAFERAVAIESAASGPDHPRVAGRLTNLGQAYANVDEFERAEAAHARAIAILEKAHGTESAKLTDAFYARGNYFVARDQCELAIPDFERARALKAKTGDPNHLHIGYLHINLGACRFYLGDGAGSEREYLRALEIVEPQRGTEDLITVMIRKDLAQAQLAAGKPEQALALARATLDTCGHLECPAHKRGDMLMTIAKANWELGHHAEAVAAMHDARREVERGEEKESLVDIDAWLAAHARE